MAGLYASTKLPLTIAVAPEAEEAAEDSVAVVATTKTVAVVEDMVAEDILAVEAETTVVSAIKATVAALEVEDGAVDSNSSPTAAAEEDTLAEVKEAMAVASRVAMTRTNNRVVVNGRRRSNPSSEFLLTSTEIPKSRTVVQTKAGAVDAHRSRA